MLNKEELKTIYNKISDYYNYEENITEFEQELKIQVHNCKIDGEPRVIHYNGECVLVVYPTGMLNICNVVEDGVYKY